MSRLKGLIGQPTWLRNISPSSSRFAPTDRTASRDPTQARRLAGAVALWPRRQPGQAKGPLYGNRGLLRVDTMTWRFGESAKELGHGRTLYGFRHFVATQLGGVATTATIRERMGHGSLEVTGGHVHRVSEADR
jgi:integrase